MSNKIQNYFYQAGFSELFSVFFLDFGEGIIEEIS
jgi:hypothetical protein